MSIDTLSRIKTYRNLYDKYAPDLSDEEKNKKAVYMSRIADQQKAIDHFYQKYTGKAPTINQRINISSGVDQGSIKGIIDAENKRIQDHNAEVKRKQKEIEENIKKQKADNKLKYEAKVDEAYKKANDSESRNFNWDAYRKMSVESKEKWLKDNNFVLTPDREDNNGNIIPGRWVKGDESAGDWIDESLDTTGNVFNATKRFFGNWIGGQDFGEALIESTALYYLDEAEDNRIRAELMANQVWVKEMDVNDVPEEYKADVQAELKKREVANK